MPKAFPLSLFLWILAHYLVYYPGVTNRIFRLSNLIRFNQNSKWNSINLINLTLIKLKTDAPMWLIWSAFNWVRLMKLIIECSKPFDYYGGNDSIDKFPFIKVNHEVILSRNWGTIKNSILRYIIFDKVRKQPLEVFCKKGCS